MATGQSKQAGKLDIGIHLMLHLIEHVSTEL